MTHPGCLVDNLIPHLVGKHHVLDNEVVLNHLVCLGTYHVAHRLVEGVYLMRKTGPPVRVYCGSGGISVCNYAYLCLNISDPKIFLDAKLCWKKLILHL